MRARSAGVGALAAVGLILQASSCRSEAGAAAQKGPSPTIAPKDVQTTRSPPSPSPGAATREASVEDIVALATDRTLWPARPEVAEERLRLFGSLKREQPVPEVLTLVGGRSGPLERVEVSYSADGKNGWIFLGASFFLGASDLPRLQKTIEADLRKQLGKPRFTKKGKGEEIPALGWKLHGRMELLLRKSPVEGEKLLLVMISEPQGGG